MTHPENTLAVRAARNAFSDRVARIRAANRTRRELVADSDYTAEEHLAIQRGLKADTRKRRPEWFA